MSSNSSDFEESLEAFSTPYFLWLEKDVLPIVMGIAILFIVIIGIIVNSLVIRAIKTNEFYVLAAKDIFIQLVVTDILAYVLVLIPSMISAFSKNWILSDAICRVQGIIQTACFLATFVFLAILCIERTMKIWNPRKHDSVFGKRKVCIGLSMMVWIVAVIVGILPLVGLGQMEYISYQHRCNVKYTNTINTNISFIGVIVIPSIIAFVCGILTYRKRKQVLYSLERCDKQVEEINLTLFRKLGEDAKNTEIEEALPKEISSISNMIHKRTTTPSSVEPCVYENDASFCVDDLIVTCAKTRSQHEMNKNSLQDGQSPSKNKVGKVKVAFDIYDSSTEQREITLTVSYILMHFIITTLWMPYIVITYVNAYDGVPVWNGFFTLCLILCDATFCIKPVIYLSHNKVLQRATAETVPESVRQRAHRAQAVLRKALKKVDEIVFVQIPDTQSLIVDMKSGRVTPID